MHEYDEMEGSITENFINNEMSFSEKMAAQVQNTPWWLISFGAHVVVLIILALIVFEGIKEKDKQSITVTDDAIAEVVEKRPERMERDTSEEIPTDEAVEVNDAAVEVTVDTAATDFGGSEVEFNSETSFAVETTSLVQSDTTSDLSFSDFGSQLVGTAKLGSELLVGGSGPYKARKGRGKKRARRAYGGGGTENSLQAGLNWLAKTQLENGGWAPKDGGRGRNNDAAAVGVSSMALLAFLGDGHDERSKKYGRNVKKAIDFLLEHSEESGKFNCHGHFMYEQGLGTMALNEALAMGIKRVKDRAEKATIFVKEAQTKAGGWLYSPSPTADAGDTSVVGFQVQALKQGKSSGHSGDALIACTKGLEGGRKWIVDRATDPQGGVGYRGPGRSPVLTGVGCVIRIYTGSTKSDEMLVKGADIVKASFFGKKNMYATYYGTLLMFQMGAVKENYWTEWNDKMKTEIVGSQVKEQGENNGSWNPDSQWSDRFGRTGQTALSVLCLEVYYRYPRYLDGKQH